MLRRDVVIAAVLAVMGLSACGAGTDEAGMGAGAGDDATAQPPRPAVLAPSDVHLLGTSDAIAQVTDLEVLPDGIVWVLNSIPPFFVGFDAAGEVVEVGK